MFETMEKALLAGIGTLSLTRQKSEELVSELQNQFNLSEEKGKELLTKFENAARENQKNLESLAQKEVHETCERLGIVTATQFVAMTKKIEQLQERVRVLENRLPQPPEDNSPGCMD